MNLRRLALGALWRALPTRVLLRVVPASMRFAAQGPISALTPALAASEKARLLVGPVNFSGQGHAFVEAAKNLPNVRAQSMQFLGKSTFAFPVDVSVPASTYAYSKTWQAAQWAAVTSGFTHVLVEAERPLFGKKFSSFSALRALKGEVRSMRAAGLKVGFICHGSDVRLPSRHARLDTDSPFAPGLLPQTPRLEVQARKHLDFLKTSAGDIFVTTPDLIQDVPQARWLPVVVDFSAVPTGQTPLTRSRPIVFHSPSNAAFKGSEIIDPIMQSLHDDGVIEYRRLSGLSHEDLLTEVSNADIVLDQFRLGSYGVAAVEALAAGRVVIGHVNDFVRNYVRASTGLDLPVVESRADDVGTTLMSILADRSMYQRGAVDGLAFAQKCHDGRFSASVLQDFLVSAD